MKRFFNFAWISSGVILLMMIAGIYAMQCVYKDVSVIRQDTAERVFSNNTSIFGKQMDDLLSNRMLILKNLAECVGKIDTTKIEELKILLNCQSDEFYEIAVIDSYGKTLCGDDLNIQNLRGETYYKELSNGKCVIDSRVYKCQNGEDVIMVYAPVVKENKTVLMVVASIKVDSLSMKLDSANFVGNGCVCIIDGSGSYLVGSSRFNSLLGDKESNHISHMENATYLQESQSSADIEETIEKRQKITTQYRYGGTEYVNTYVPLGINDWYLVAIAPLQEISTEDKVITWKTALSVIISILLLIAAIAVFIITILRNHKLAKEIKRHRVLQKCERAVSFELNFKPHYLEFYGDLKSMIGVDHGPLSGEEVYDIYDWIHEDDSSLRGRLHQFFESDEEMFLAEVRIRNIKGSYGWYRIVGIMQRDRFNEKNQWFVGKIFNVDEHMREEKELVQRAENDLLTGVLNKKTMEKRVSHMIKNRGNEYVIFYMVDLDNFKNVNDSLGHIYGDQAIVETAQCLNKVFADQDCIGRLGGDEFAVCVSYLAFDEQGLYEFIEKKAEKICQVNRRTYSDGAVEVSISSSVGIAIAPDMGEDFESLYQKADRALYYSKEHGKNQFHIYTSEDN